MARKEGRWRLQMLLSVVGGSICIALMAVVVWVYKAPYNLNWWWVMGAILGLAILVPRTLVFPVEWVIEGYRADRDKAGQ